MDMSFKEPPLSVQEYKELEQEVENFKHFLETWSSLESQKAPNVNLSNLYKFSGSENQYELVIYYPFYNKSPEVLNKGAFLNAIGSFGCVFITKKFFFFPMPLKVFEGRKADFWLTIHKSDTKEEHDFIIALSKMYKRGISKEGLFDAMSEKFGEVVTSNYFGVKRFFSYFDVLQKVLKDGYGIEKNIKFPSTLIKTIYDTWDILLSSRDVSNMEPVKRLWNLTKYKLK